MLNCIVICRSMDKKPCDNIMNSPTFSKLIDKISLDQEGGVSMKTLDKSNSPMNKFFDRSVGSVDQAICEGSTGASVSNISRRCTKPRAISTLIVDSAGLGNYFAPLLGNQHRIIGLIQRNSVVQ